MHGVPTAPMTQIPHLEVEGPKRKARALKALTPLLVKVEGIRARVMGRTRTATTLLRPLVRGRRAGGWA